ncbi:hypothetical protein [uncultured Helicobacter sp.]|uniref:hypothetical protein n=1 Tax=uncultured Helicobacter sp. TaxID=175537 RepID=UPI00375289BF
MSLCYFIESKPPSDITESKQAKVIDLGSVCTHSGEGLYPKPRYQVCLANLYENTESRADSESKVTESSFLESKSITQSTTPKNPNEVLPRQGKARLSPRLRKKTQRVASEAQQKQRRFILFGAGESGERGNPFSFCANK